MTAEDHTDESLEDVPVPVVDEPADGVPDVVADAELLAKAAEAVRSGRGPVAIDAERASGYRYGQRAYLVQLRREGAGTWLIDPIACPDLTTLEVAIGDAEWVLHAATQDLPCLAELGLRPRHLFDTELGGRLAGLPRVGLAAVVEHYLGVTLAKEHSAVDWSSRPLPEPWLRYAALDVELLVEARDRLKEDLRRQGKLGWAEQEFAALTSFTGPPPRSEPWRRTSGMHKVRSRRQAALVRELWQTRDEIARTRDVSPGRVLPDSALIELALREPHSGAELGDIRARGARRYQRQWFAALRRGRALSEQDLPALTVRNDGPPPARVWADRDPVAAARLNETRETLKAFSEENGVPVENLLTPDLLRRVLWSPPADTSVGGFAAALTEQGARGWQVEITAPLLAHAVARHPGE
ncbi:MAG TPA: HRDC domain-containing protein [Segeticoccus sp.]|uniref:ribonuclease D n=1 Tax=Segeticoccus sp. TaxID=2706531 RepID=UPI002D7EDFE8|nr:HRDC domain-containing protein [Segeticoccus sp.]HET8601406.1 HRDC domain-containing protein [Segeticoccus sp.]